MSTTPDNCYEDIKYSISHGDGFRIEVFNEDCSIAVVYSEYNDDIKKWEEKEKVLIPECMAYRVSDFIQLLADNKKLFEA